MNNSSALREARTRSPFWRLQAKAEIEARKRKGIYRTATDTVAVSAFEDWLGIISPTWQWQWQHLCFIREQLDRITYEGLKRLMLFLPPRHGKSEMVTIRYPVWRLERSPSMRVIIAAYNQTLVNKFSRKARAIARRRMILSEHRTAVEEWETTAGGGLRAVGVGVGITGQGGDLIIIDDPVKNRAEANSLTYREHVWEWWRDDLYTRQEPECAMVIIMTRWHEDDLAGRILNSSAGSDWEVVSLPAIAEDADPLGREPGAALCPERFPIEDLRRIEEVLGSSFWALYQQSPQAQTGNLAERLWFDVVDQAPAPTATIRTWDFAATEKKLSKADPDFTVGQRWSTSKGNYYIEDVIRLRVEPAQVEELVMHTARLDGKTVAIHLEQEPGSAGKIFVDRLIRMLAGYNVTASVPSGDKITRALPWLAQARALHVFLVRGRWNGAWLDEICAVPNAPHDDQWDTASSAFQRLLDEKPKSGSTEY